MSLPAQTLEGSFERRLRASAGGILPPVAGFGPAAAVADPASLVPTSQESLFAGLWKPGYASVGLFGRGGFRGGRGGFRGGRRSSLRELSLSGLGGLGSLPPIEPSAVKALAQKGRLDAIFDPQTRKDLISRGRNDTCEFCGKVGLKIDSNCFLGENFAIFRCSRR